MPLDPRLSFKAPNWDDVFPKRQPLGLEIGFGRGEFLTELAETNPNTNFIGIEVRDTNIEKAKGRIEKAKVSNAYVLRCNALAYLEELTIPKSLKQIFVNFPDPWWKKRHHKRRIFTPEMIGRMSDLLTPEGTIYVVTDVGPYHKVIRDLFSERQDFELASASGPDAKEKLGLDWYPTIIREENYLKAGRNINFLVAKANGISS